MGLFAETVHDKIRKVVQEKTKHLITTTCDYKLHQEDWQRLQEIKQDLAKSAFNSMDDYITDISTSKETIMEFKAFVAPVGEVQDLLDAVYSLGFQEGIKNKKLLDKYF